MKINKKDLFSNVSNREDLEEAKLKQENEKKCKNILKELAFNCLFLTSLVIVCFANKNNMVFSYQNQIALQLNDDTNEQFLNATNAVEFYQWVSEFLLLVIKPNKSMYSNGTYFQNNSNYIIDFSSVLVGHPIIRQSRAKKGFKNIYSFALISFRI